jgi:hypothetical protein
MVKKDMDVYIFLLSKNPYKVSHQLIVFDNQPVRSWFGMTYFRDDWEIFLDSLFGKRAETFLSQAISAVATGGWLRSYRGTRCPVNQRVKLCEARPS